MSLSTQYPDAAWLVTALSGYDRVLRVVATVWMPGVPKEPTGLFYAVFYRLAHALPHTSGRTRAPWLTASPKP